MYVEEKLGQFPIVTGEPISTGVLTALTALPIFGGLFKPNLKKLANTAGVEQGQQELNRIWFQVSGEALNGVERVAEPGQYGRAGIPLWELSTQSRYPNVPKGAAGDPSIDIDAAIAAAQSIIEQTRQNMQREASLDNRFFTQYGPGIVRLLERVKAAREAPDLVQSVIGGNGLRKLLPWGLAAVGVYLLAR